MRTRSAVLPCLLAAGVLVSATGPAPAASAPRCTVAKGAVLSLETPELLVTSAALKRRKGSGRTVRTTACRRASGRRTILFDDYDVPGAAGGGQIVGLIDRRWVVVREFGGGAESEEVTVHVTDTSTSKRTSDVTIGGTDATGEAVTGRPGMLSVTFGIGNRAVYLRRPGVGGQAVSAGPAPTAAALAIGASTAYWRETTGSEPAPATPAPSLARGVAPATAVVRAAPPKPSPKGTKGRCERSGTTTLLRVVGARLLRTAAGDTVLCRTGRAGDLTIGTLVPGTTTTVDDASITVLQGLDRASLRGRTADGRDVAIVLDLATGKASHVAVAPAGSAFAIDVDGIAVADAAGPLRWVTAATSTTIADAGALASDATGPDPAIAPRTDDGEREAVVHWRGADGAGVSWTAPARKP